jgi:hypothetical protein
MIIMGTNWGGNSPLPENCSFFCWGCNSGRRKEAFGSYKKWFFFSVERMIGLHARTFRRGPVFLYTEKGLGVPRITPCCISQASRSLNAGNVKICGGILIQNQSSLDISFALPFSSSSLYIQKNSYIGVSLSSFLLLLIRIVVVVLGWAGGLESYPLWYNSQSRS